MRCKKTAASTCRNFATPGQVMVSWDLITFSVEVQNNAHYMSSLEGGVFFRATMPLTISPFICGNMYETVRRKMFAPCSRSRWVTQRLRHSIWTGTSDQTHAFFLPSHLSPCCCFPEWALEKSDHSLKQKIRINLVWGSTALYLQVNLRSLKSTNMFKYRI